jgi:predicted PhzF superfamily epimerase YddE/YHI9
LLQLTFQIFSQLDRLKYTGAADREAPPQTGVLLTKAGQIPIFYDNYRQLSACTVPHNVRIHSKQISLDNVLVVQPQLQIVPTVDVLKGRTFPVVSIVKGMTFALVDLTGAPEVMVALEVGKSPAVELDEEWGPSFAGALYYSRSNLAERNGEPAIHNIHARMITQGIEDPGTGSACCALACYLALTAEEPKKEGVEELAKLTAAVKLDEKPEHHVFAIEQGVEMGRKCMIAVEVDVKTDQEGKRKIANVILSGRANLFLMGQILGD